MAVKLAKEPAAIVPQSLDKKPRRLIQTEQVTARYHASASIRTTGVAVEKGKELEPCICDASAGRFVV